MENNNYYLIPLLDLTSLNADDTTATITTLCQQAITPYGNVAAVCVYPQFVKLAKQLLQNTSVKIATVANFPLGNDPLSQVITAIEQAITDQADEIDIVIPYQTYLAGEHNVVRTFTQSCKTSCGTAIKLKIILETGALADANKIADASMQAIAGGADFIKTSTGKYAINATPTAAKIMLTMIKEMTNNSTTTVGFKAAGGIQTITQANEYLQLAEEILGKEWVTPKTFRIGTSRLLQDILKTKRADQ